MIPRPANEGAELYRRYLASIGLAMVKAATSVDRQGMLHTVIFNGYVPGIDPRTGHDGESCVLSIQVSSQDLKALRLERVDPLACADGLGARITRNPHSMQPVIPFQVN